MGAWVLFFGMYGGGQYVAPSLVTVTASGVADLVTTGRAADLVTAGPVADLITTSGGRA